jgi:hypothetical protein
VKVHRLFHQAGASKRGKFGNFKTGRVARTLESNDRRTSGGGTLTSLKTL